MGKVREERWVGKELRNFKDGGKGGDEKGGKGEREEHTGLEWKESESKQQPS